MRLLIHSVREIGCQKMSYKSEFINFVDFILKQVHRTPTICQTMLCPSKSFSEVFPLDVIGFLASSAFFYEDGIMRELE